MRWKHNSREYEPEYQSWVAMRHRCNNPKRQAYSKYGGRGIKVCKRWDSFDKFVEDMGRRPDNTTLDRKKVNKGYSPGNCRWADRKTQARGSKIYEDGAHCRICDLEASPLRKGRCHRCDEFFRRNGVEWHPESKYRKRAPDRYCDNCAKLVPKGWSKGRCPSCRIYFTQHGRERPLPS